MKILAELRKDGRGRDMSAVIEHIPYARFLGLTVEQKGTEVTTILPFAEKLIGNTQLPALHGGAIGAFLEVSAIIHLLAEVECEKIPRTVDFSINYLRSGRPMPTYARSVISKHGRRVANVRVEAWQDEVDRPIATGYGHFLMSTMT